MNQEVQYRELPEYPNYRFGSDGTVWSCKRGGWRRLGGSINSMGYHVVGLYLPGKGGAMYKVHRLILEAFTGPCPQCGEAQASLRLDLADMDTVYCAECEGEFSLDDLRGRMDQWQKLLLWRDLAPRSEPTAAA